MQEDKTARRRAYMREWMRAYRANNAEHCRELNRNRMRAYRARHPEYVEFEHAMRYWKD